MFGSDGPLRIGEQTIADNVTDALARNVYRCQGGIAEFGELDVVEPCHGNVLRHAEAALSKLAQRPHSRNIVDADNGRRLVAGSEQRARSLPATLERIGVSRGLNLKR